MPKSQKVFLTAKRGKADSYKEAVEIAKQTIDSGKVMDKVNEFVAETKKFN